MFITLYNFFFMPNDREKHIDRDFTYVHFLHTDDSTLIISPICYKSEPVFDSNALSWAPQRGPIHIELDFDPEDKLREHVGKNSKICKLTTCNTSIEVDEVNLHSGKVLLPRLTPYVELVCDVPLIEASMSSHTFIDYNFLAHLRKFTINLSIYNTLILSKKMEDSLVKVLLNPKIFLADLNDFSYIEQKTPKIMEESPRITFHDIYLLLETTIYNKPLYISTYFGRFRVVMILVNPSTFSSIMSLTIFINLQVDVFWLQGNKMLLKGFNEFGERSLGYITLAFELDGWEFEVKFHIINIHTSFNALLGRL